MAGPNKTPSPVFLDGVQRVAKFNKTEKDVVTIFLALYRLPEQNVDMVFTANVPTVTSSGTIGDTTVLGVKEAFRTCAKSLQIVDWGLFGNNSS
jgi:Ran-interacting Mog1 protein